MSKLNQDNTMRNDQATMQVKLNPSQVPELSPMMSQLYGAAADQVNQRCYDLDPVFGEFVQRVVYDQLWALPPLSLREKSLVTIISLALLGKEEQLEIHIKGFLKSAGTVDELLSLFDTMVEKKLLASADGVLLSLKKVLKSDEPLSGDRKDKLPNSTLAIIDLVACVALGREEKTKLNSVCVIY